MSHPLILAQILALHSNFTLPVYPTLALRPHDPYILRINGHTLTGTPVGSLLDLRIDNDWLDSLCVTQAWDLPICFGVDQEIPWLEPQLHHRVHSVQLSDGNQPPFAFQSPSLAKLEASPATSDPPTSETSSNPANALTPILQACPNCGTKMSFQRLKNHRTSSACGTRFSCKEGDEPGCHLAFRYKKDQQRHWEQVCQKAGKLLNPFRCCCGEEVRGWDRFMRHLNRCTSTAEQRNSRQYLCFCGMLFETMPTLQTHHSSAHKKRPGRPLKGS